MKITRLSASFVALCMQVLAAKSGAAQDAESDSKARMSREEWLANVEDSRRRIDQMRQQHKSFLPSEPSLEQEAQDRSRRAMEDESLQAGDIVATQRGFLRFRGRPDDVHKPEDFVPLDRKQ